MQNEFDKRCEEFTKEFIATNKPVIRYVRDKKRKPVGVLIAYLKKGKIRIGYSKCMIKKEGEKVDEYRRNRGLYIAAERASAKPLAKKDTSKPKSKKDETRYYEIPHTIREYLGRFVKDCKKYFKTDKIG